MSKITKYIILITSVILSGILFGQNNKGDYTNGGLIKSSDILIKK